MTQYSAGGATVILTVTELHPYHTYSCRVAAATSIGIGPFTPAILLETLEDGKSVIIAIACKQYRTYIHVLLLRVSNSSIHSTVRHARILQVWR